MKRFYFLPALITILTIGSFTAHAQRTVNMQTSLKTPINNQTVTIGTPFTFRVEFKNLGPDTLKATDTLYYTFTGAGTNVYYRTGMTKKTGDTILLNTSLTFSSASVAQLRFCVYSVISSPSVVDPTRGNDSSCIATLKINQGGGSTGINTVVSFSSEPTSENLTVYPNPAVGLISLDYTARNTSDVTARVLDLAGRVVMVKEFGKAYPGKTGFSLDVNALTSGMYFVELRQDGVRAVGKINKQ